MPQIKGWERLYPPAGEHTSKPTHGKGRKRPVIFEWSNLSGQTVTIERNCKWQNESGELFDRHAEGRTVYYPDIDEIPLDEGRWVVTFPHGNQAFFSTRNEATDEARRYMRSFYSEGKLRQEKAALASR